MRENERFDVTIIGGGPAGLFAAFYSGLREMKTKIIESQPQLGGKLHVYPEKMIWDVGGIPPIPGAQLMEQLVKQGLTFHPTVVLNEKIVAIEKNADGLFVLRAESGRQHVSGTVIVAVGGGIVTPQKLSVEGAEKFEEANLHYAIRSLKRFQDKTVLISGGGHTAVDWANELEPIAKKVYVVYRKDAFNAHEAQVTQLFNSSAECFFHTRITALLPNGQGESIEKVELIHEPTGEVFRLAVDEVIISHGYLRDKELLKQSPLGIVLDEDGYIAGTPAGETSVPGLFAAGDALSYEGKVHLIAGAFQDAINAVNQAKSFLQPDAPRRGIVSSHNDLFNERNRILIEQLLNA